MNTLKKKAGEIITSESFVFVNCRSISSKVEMLITSQTLISAPKRIVDNAKIQRVRSENGNILIYYWKWISQKIQYYKIKSKH